MHILKIVRNMAKKIMWETSNKVRTNLGKKKFLELVEAQKKR